MEHRHWPNIGNVLVAATPSGDSVIFDVSQYNVDKVKYSVVGFYFNAADAEKIGRALIFAAHAARPALAEVRPAETETV
jgi:hypothetical protein